jgi:hypothetical protein
VSSLSWLSIVPLAAMALGPVAESRVSQTRHPARPMSIMSIPVSPSVVATAATTEGQLVVLVLWRGAARWYMSGPRHEQAGGDQNGKLHVSLQYGERQIDLSFDPGAGTAIVQGKTVKVSPKTNVLLVDGVDTPTRGSLSTALSIDATGVDLNPRGGMAGWGPLFSRSRQMVEFLQCEAVPDPRFAGPCRQLEAR